MRAYRRKAPARYTVRQLEVAVEAVKCGDLKLCQAVRRFNIPLTTLGDHARRGLSTVGAGSPTILTRAEEKEIVVSAQVLQEIGFGLTKDLVGVVVRNYLKDQPFRPRVPGQDWWQCFLKRWDSELSVRKPQYLPTHRAASATTEVGFYVYARFWKRLVYTHCHLMNLVNTYGIVMKPGSPPLWHLRRSLPNGERRMSKKLSVVMDETTLRYLVQDQQMVPAYHHLLYTKLRISGVGG